VGRRGRLLAGPVRRPLRHLAVVKGSVEARVAEFERDIARAAVASGLGDDLVDDLAEFLAHLSLMRPELVDGHQARLFLDLARAVRFTPADPDA